MARVCQHTSAEDVLCFTYSALMEHEESSNIVLAQALQSCATPYSGGDDTNHRDWNALFERPYRAAEQFWLTVWTKSGGEASPTLVIFLSCVGESPIFLWAPSTYRTEKWLDGAMKNLVAHFVHWVNPERVFSVFGKQSLTLAFERAWTESTGRTRVPEPYYDAVSSRCTLHSFIDASDHLPNHTTRIADVNDVERVAALCKEFAEASVRSF